MRTMLIQEFQELPVDHRAIQAGVTMVLDDGRLVPIRLESHRAREARQNGTSPNDSHSWGFWISEGEEEWSYAWRELFAKAGSAASPHGDDWQYLGTESTIRVPAFRDGRCVRPDEDPPFAGASPTLAFFHCFRHRNLHGHRVTEWIPASPSWLPPNEGGSHGRMG